MKKKMLSILLVGIMTTTLLTGCKTSSDQSSSTATSEASTSSASGSSTSSKDAIRLVNGKIEIDSQLKAAAKQYEKETGQAVEIESIGGGVDIQGQLKSYYASDNMPDMFVIGGDGDYANWQGKCADLSDTKFAADTDFAYKDSKDGTVVGFPYAVEGYGITYNADILQKSRN